LRLRDGTRASCAQVTRAARAKLDDIEAKLASLKAMKRALTVLLRSCAGNERERRCPLLESLDAGSA